MNTSNYMTMNSPNASDVLPCLIITLNTSKIGVSQDFVNMTSTRDCYLGYNTLPETVVYGIYALAALLLGIVGNTVVILATLKYTVFSLDSITMVFVRHLAIADILYILIRIFPSISVHFGRGWVMGRGLCFFLAHIVTVTSLASMNFILTISIHRLLRCMFPLRFSLSVRNKATILALVLWAYSSIGAIISLSLNIKVYFRPVLASCDIDYTSQPILAATGTVVQMLIPFFAIIFTNISMYIIAKTRFKDMTNNHAIITVSSVSGLFIVSWLPSILIILLGVGKIQSTQLIWLDKLQINFYFISVFGNPLIYSFVHKGFGKFARAKFSIFLRKCQNSVEAQWNNSVSKSSENHAAEQAAMEAEGKKYARRGSKRASKESLRRGSRELINDISKDILITEEHVGRSQDFLADTGSISKDSGLYSSGM